MGDGPVPRRHGHLLGPLKPILKCSAQSIQQIQCRPTAQQEPRNRIRANAENPKTSHSSLFERRLNLLIKMYRTPVSGVFRRRASGFAVCGKSLATVSRFVAGIRQSFK
jgi:hypothetical protein